MDPRSLSPDTFGRLGNDPLASKKVIDKWASVQTKRKIRHIPCGPIKENGLLLVSALTLDITWKRKFEAGGKLVDGVYRDYLFRHSVDITIVQWSNDLTITRVDGRQGVNVYLVMGQPDAPANKVLEAGINAIAHGTGVQQLTPANAKIATGPGIEVTTITVKEHEPDQQLYLTTPEFVVEAEHDLLRKGLFGLQAPDGKDERQFPGIGPEVFVQAGKQTATALFSDEGFKAAAVTVVECSAKKARRPKTPIYKEALQVAVDYKPPLGFLAVHEESKAILFGGWVTDDQVPIDESDEESDEDTSEDESSDWRP